eukprot:maker-scaffold_6-snap-gene-19.48-mRNA-1 protein AED:0.01 eAED:0.01 QI:27/1/1/1/1/1/4/651/484
MMKNYVSDRNFLHLCRKFSTCHLIHSTQNNAMIKRFQFARPGLVRRFSTTESKVVEKVKHNDSKLKTIGRPASFWRRPWQHRGFRRGFRGLRTGVLLFTFGSTCYALGQVEYLDDPIGFEQKALKTVLPTQQQISCVSEEERHPQVLIIDKNIRVGFQQSILKHDISEKELRKLQKTFSRVKKSFIDEIEEIISVLLLEVQRTSIINAYQQDELRRWEKKKEFLLDHWTLLVVDQNEPNAFVNSFLPKKIFVTKGLLKQYGGAEEQLAYVLAHELSHFVLSHTKDLLMFDAIIQSAVLLVISLLDVTGGLLTFLPEILTPLVGKVIGRGYSREQETRADLMGLRMASRACYEPEKALKLFESMHRIQMGNPNEPINLNEKGNGELGLSLLSTHPLTKERIKQSMAALDECKEIYKRQGCDEYFVQKFFKFLLLQHKADPYDLAAIHMIEKNTSEIPVSMELRKDEPPPTDEAPVNGQSTATSTV